MTIIWFQWEMHLNIHYTSKIQGKKKKTKEESESKIEDDMDKLKALLARRLSRGKVK